MSPYTYYQNLLEDKRISDKISVIFKSPGWAPGLPRRGRLEDIPDVKFPVPKYDPQIPFWCELYVLCHFVISVLGYVAFFNLHLEIPQVAAYGMAIFEIFTLITLGTLNEGRSYAPWLELIRCVTFIILDCFFFPITELARIPVLYKHIAVTFIRITYVVSLLGFLMGCIRTVSIKLHSNKKLK